MWVELAEPLTNAVPEVVQTAVWYVTYVATPLVVAIVGFVTTVKLARAKAWKKAEAEPSKTQALPAPNPYATPPQTDSALVALSLQTTIRQLEWNTEDIRNTNRQLRRDLSDMTDENSRLSGALARERAARAKAEQQVIGKDSQLQTLTDAMTRITAEREQAARALAAATAREQAAAAELSEYKRAVQAGHTTQPSDASITPLRPGPLGRGKL